MYKFTFDLGDFCHLSVELVTLNSCISLLSRVEVEVVSITNDKQLWHRIVQFINGCGLDGLFLPCFQGAIIMPLMRLLAGGIYPFNETNLKLVLKIIYKGHCPSADLR